ncbi:MAG: tetratricopeptide repeat protein [Sedimentisphaerales bacterium]|nr:tetratricopeptide repeat protein [Sedimentisphaerales bacterium]
MKAEEFLRAGQLKEALTALEAEIRANPANPKLRVLLFQMLSVMGDWKRALTQLNVAAEMDPANLLMAQVCRVALNCEALRAAIFAGERVPLLFGEPEDWVGHMVQANQMVGQGQYQASQKLRDQAFESAPAVAGTINGEPFEWIADADTRMGPILEAIVEGRYYWVPFTNIKSISIDIPTDLRDVVWIPAKFTWANEGESMGLIPTRYPGSEMSEDNEIRLARKTEWQEYDGDLYLGLGQRMFATNAGEYSLLETRDITLEVVSADTPESEGENADG